MELLKDVICLQSDGCNTMVSLGHKVSDVISHQLCYAHCLQLAICDTFYEKTGKISRSKDDSTEEEDNSENDELIDLEDCVVPNEHYDDLMMVFDNNEVDLMIRKDILNLIKRIRMITKIFRRSACELVLDEIIFEKFKETIKLELDSVTRWTSMYQMLAKFIKLYECIESAIVKCKQKKFITYEESTILNNFPIQLIQEPFNVLKQLVLMNEVLSKADTDLIEAENIKDFTIKELSKMKSPLANQLKYNLIKRYDQRRTIYTQLLKYLRFKDLGNMNENEMKLELMTLMSRLFFNNDNNSFDQSTHSSVSQNSLSSVSEQSTSIESAVCDNISDLMDRWTSYKIKCKSNQLPEIEPDTDEEIIKKEIEKFSALNKKGDNLVKLEKALSTIKPSTVDVERVFSHSRLVLTTERNRLGDKLADEIMFLKYYFNQLK